jgi:hyperosmotically inducible protein
MNARSTLAALLTAVALTALQACAVTEGQQSVGSYIDDSAITTAVKSKFVDSKQVDAGLISVETMKGNVQLSGYAKSDAEKAMAESLARQVKGVTGVTNSVQVRR